MAQVLVDSHKADNYQPFVADYGKEHFYTLISLMKCAVHFDLMTSKLQRIKQTLPRQRPHQDASTRQRGGGGEETNALEPSFA